MKRILTKVVTFSGYLLGKKSELKDIGYKDLVLGRLVLKIHRERTHSEQIWVPLSYLQPIHAIDRDNAIEATNTRVEQLKIQKTVLLENPRISKQALSAVLPSVSGIKVVQMSDDCFVAFEGNGRVVALQQVFDEGDSLVLEVERYVFANSEKIHKRIRYLRKLNGFE